MDPGDPLFLHQAKRLLHPPIVPTACLTYPGPPPPPEASPLCPPLVPHVPACRVFSEPRNVNGAPWNAPGPAEVQRRTPTLGSDARGSRCNTLQPVCVAWSMVEPGQGSPRSHWMRRALRILFSPMDAASLWHTVFHVHGGSGPRLHERGFSIASTEAWFTWGATCIASGALTNGRCVSVCFMHCHCTCQLAWRNA